MNKAELATKLYAAGKIGAWYGDKRYVRVQINSKWWTLKGALQDSLAASLQGSAPVLTTLATSTVWTARYAPGLFSVDSP